MDWKIIDKCDHEWSDYYDTGPCETQYCIWTENHCKKCGVYRVHCGCGYHNHLSKIPYKNEDWDKMSKSIEIKAFRPADENWEKMKAVWEACTKAEVKIPQEVGDFFNWQTPDPAGVETDISEAVTNWDADMQEGCEVDLLVIPKGVRRIRFIVSY